MMLRAARRSLSTVGRGCDRAAIGFAPGDIRHGFRVIAVTPIAPFNVDVYQMVHEATGAEYLHVDAADSNNTFAVMFRTPPNDSTGVAHILEHTALCGSKAFPVRDPFFHMLRRSLSNFMNAMTGQEYTMYPFSTCHPRDYDNLLRVYTDATFFPLLSASDFMQEGHRLEYDTWNDSSTELAIKGVVYNEMKGAMSDPGSILHEQLGKALFPATQYRHNSGGDPAQIPMLTHAQLVEFHRDHYHPSNARFYSYGDLPPPLAFINESVLSKFEWRGDVDTIVQLQPHFNAPPPVVTFAGPPDPMIIDPIKQTSLSESVMCQDIASADPVDITAMHLISSLLLNGADSPFHQSLIAPNFGSGYSPLTGLSPSRQMVWSIGLHGISGADVPRVQDAIHTTLADVLRRDDGGFPSHRIDAVLHQYRLRQQEIKTNFGLEVLYRMTPRWIHGCSPVPALQLNEHLAQIHGRMEQGTYLQDLIRDNLVDNSHRVTLLMTADPDYMGRRAQAEKTLLQTLRPPADVIERAGLLADAQEAPSNVACLPTLRTSDIDLISASENRNITVDNRDPVPTQWVDQTTNGIVYYRALFNTTAISAELRPLLPLFCSIVNSMGAANRSYKDMSHLRSLYTGGLAARLNNFSPIDRLDRHTEVVTFRGSCLAHNAERMFDLMVDTISNADFNDLDRLRQLLTDLAASVSASVVDSGHAFASMHASSAHSPCLAAQERYSGLSQVVFLNRLASRLANDDLCALSRQLESIRAQLLLDRCSIVIDGGAINAVRVHSAKFIERLAPAAVIRTPSLMSTAPAVSPVISDTRQTFFGVPIEVNNVAMSIAVPVPYAHADSAALRVLARIMSVEHLHRELREKGGAYGGGASWSPDGAFVLHSFRDPHVDGTIDTFRRALQWSQDGDQVTGERIEQALLSIFSSLDAPMHPSTQGSLQFVEGISPDERLAHRRCLLGLRADDIVDAARRHLGDASKAHISVVGNNDLIEEIGASGGSWTARSLNDLIDARSGAEGNKQANVTPIIV